MANILNDQGFSGNKKNYLNIINAAEIIVIPFREAAFFRIVLKCA